MSKLVTWRPTQAARSKGCPKKTYVDLPEDDTGYAINEVENSMKDRRIWRASTARVNGVSEWVSEWVVTLATDSTVVEISFKWHLYLTAWMNQHACYQQALAFFIIMSISQIFVLICPKEVQRGNLPFMPFCHHTWKGVIVPLDIFDFLAGQTISCCT